MADKIEIKTEKKLKSKKYNYDEKKERERMLVIIINIFIFGDIEFLKSILLKEKDDLSTINEDLSDLNLSSDKSGIT